MPPKVKITKGEIINAALEIVRINGEQAINARSIAATLNCSTQPVFSNFSSMESLYLAVAQRADLLCREYIRRDVESGEYPPYKASGLAYIRFAKEERELFKLLYMCDRFGEPLPEGNQLHNDMEMIVQKNTGMDEQSSKRFHLEMWAFVHGIATMFATGFLDLDWELVSHMLSDAYLGLRKQYGME